MADRKATNKYYPPDWDPSKGSINSYVGQHPLRDRARKLDQGILIVRFEMPFNIWCGGCKKSIGKGVRFNAEKKKIGNYYTTAILSFRMKCAGCSQWIEIHTDPKNAAYVVVSGARKKMEDYEPEDNETIRLTSEEERRKLAEDPFYMLEMKGEDERKAKLEIPKLTMLQRLNDAHWADPYTNSQKLRRIHREERKANQKIAKECEALAAKNSLSIPVLPLTAEDTKAASAIDFSKGTALAAVRKRRIETLGRGIFDEPSAADTSKRRKGTDGTAMMKSPTTSSSSSSSSSVVKRTSAPVLSASVVSAGLGLAAARTKFRADPFSWATGWGKAIVGPRNKNTNGRVIEGVALKKDHAGCSSSESSSASGDRVTTSAGGVDRMDRSATNVGAGETVESAKVSLVSAQYDDGEDEDEDEDEDDDVT